MKKIIILSIGLLGARALFAQEPSAADSTGLPGDHFSLQGALELFSKAKDLEAFEKALNTAENKVNNLDLDGDGHVDYVRVVDIAKGDVHAIVLRVPVSKDEQQDVAVIELEKTGEKSARALIRGDAILYGDSVLLEPVAEVMKSAGSGPDMGEVYPVYVWVNVWGWPSVQWFYGPYYSYWDSPWYWGYYPRWYSPWRPWGWRTWWGYGHYYNSWCRPVHYSTPTHASTVYAPRRSMSNRVVQDTRSTREVRMREGTRAPQLRGDAVRSSGGVQRTVQERPMDRSQRSVARTAPEQRATGVERSPRGVQDGRSSDGRAVSPATRPGASEQRSGTRPSTREGVSTRPQVAPRDQQRTGPTRQETRSRQSPSQPQRSVQPSRPSRGTAAPARSAPSRSTPSAPSRGSSPSRSPGRGR